MTERTCVRIAVPGRWLVVVGGMPGAGKSTLLAGLPPDVRVTVVDSDGQRARLRRLLPRAPYAAYRWAVHLAHRVVVLWAARSRVPVVVVHLPATAPRTRAGLARLAELTGRRAHLVWLHVDAHEARLGQHVRGRLVRERAHAGHAVRATDTTADLVAGLAAGRTPDGWHGVTVLDRVQARGGLHLDGDSGSAVRSHRAPMRAPGPPQ